MDNDAPWVPSLNLLLLLKESGQDLFHLSLNELLESLRAGVVLRDKQNAPEQLFWMDEKLNTNCFLLLPKALRISTDSIGNQGPQYEQGSVKLGSGKEISLPMVRYDKTRHIRIGGELGGVGLSPNGEYQVVLCLKILQPEAVPSASKKRLSLPDGRQIQEPWTFVGRIPTRQWFEYQVGSFQMKPNYVGGLSFDIQVYFWARPDIVIKGVAVKAPSGKI